MPARERNSSAAGAETTGGRDVRTAGSLSRRERHEDTGAAAGAGLDLEALRERRHEGEAEAEPGAVGPRHHPAALVAHEDLDDVVGQALGDDLDLAGLGRADVGVHDSVRDRLRHGERDRVGIRRAVLLGVVADLVADGRDLIGPGREATYESRRVQADFTPPDAPPPAGRRWGGIISVRSR